MSGVATGAPGILGTELMSQLDGGDSAVRYLTLSRIDTTSLDPYDVDVYVGDATDESTVDAVFDGTVETVFHCAGIIHPSDLLGADTVYGVTTQGTRHLLEAARNHGARISPSRSTGKPSGEGVV